MKIEIRERPHKTVLYWLNREEGSDKMLLASLRPEFKGWKLRKYQPVILESGKENLEDGMYMLMKRNYEIIAKKELS